MTQLHGLYLFFQFFSSENKNDTVMMVYCIIISILSKSTEGGGRWVGRGGGWSRPVGRLKSQAAY